MIELHEVSRTLVDEKRANQTSLHHVNVALWERGTIAAVGREHATSSLLLHLIAGSEVPDRGTVTSRGVRFSPIVNAGGVPGSALMPHISALDNIRFFARVHGLDGSALAAVVDAACGFGPRLNASVRHLDGHMRRALEAVLIAALPYDCYIVDRFETLQVELQWLLSKAARRRGSGMIFATGDPAVGRQFAEAGILVENGRVLPLPVVNFT